MSKKRKKSQPSESSGLAKYLLAFYVAGAAVVFVLYKIGSSSNELLKISSAIFASGIAGYWIIRLLVWFNQKEVVNLPAIQHQVWLLPGLLISLAILCVLASLLWIIPKYWPLPVNDLQQTARQINNRVTYWKIAPIRLSFKAAPQTSRLKNQITLANLGCSSEPKAQFVITPQSTAEGLAFQFSAYEYTFETGGDPTKLPNTDICEFINSRYDEKSPFLEALKRVNIEYSIPVGPGKFKVSINELSAELIYAIMALHKAAGSCTEVLVKGYADGQITPWALPIKSGKYQYQYLEVYPAVDPQSQNPLEYKHELSPYPIGDSYDNRKLPNLRAEFVKEELIRPMLKACNTWKEISVQIIDGYEFSQWNPEDRKVQIYVMIF